MNAGLREANTLAEKESPLELLALQVRELELRRDAVEEELDQMPTWRFRRRAQLEGQLRYSQEQERDLMILVGMAAEKLKPRRRSLRH